MGFLLEVITTVILLFSSQVFGQINRQPMFITGGDLKSFALREDTPVGSSVYTLRGRDPENTRVFYYISGDSFTVNKDTGVVQLIKPLDRETEQVADIIASITDEEFQGKDANTVSVKRVIKILDVNDNAPVFQNVPYAFSVNEDTVVGTVAYTGVLITDADEGKNADVTLTCSKTASPDACAKFDVHLVKLFKGRYRGELILKERLDYETNTTYTMILEAQDDSDIKKLKTTAEIKISVKDVQDRPPLFTNAPYSATIPENTIEGTSVLRISVKDGDFGDPRPMALEIQNDPMGYFKLAGTSQDDKGIYSADLETSDVPIDREHPSILGNGGLYLFQVKATEIIDDYRQGDTTLSNVTIVVGDVNDHPPEFNKDLFNISISEDIANNTPVPGLDIEVSDHDVGENAKFSLSLEDVSNSVGVFSIFPTMAVGRTPVIIKVIDANKLDYEDPDKRFFQFRIKAEQENSKTSFADVMINLFDANDNAPVFSQRHYQVQVAENTPAGTAVYTLEASDADSGNFGRISYSVKGSDKFTVDSETGVLRVAPCHERSCLDYEVQQAYSLTYDAQDGDGRIASVNIFVEITDLNDNYPVFQKEEYIREIQEKTWNFTPPFYVKATDVDGPSQGGGLVTYSVRQESEESLDPVPVSIHPKTGEVTLVKPLVYAEIPDKSGQVVLTVQATDSGHPPLTSETRLVVKVRKENYGAPEFVNEPYRASIKENAPPGTEVFKVSATDPDGPDSAIRFVTASGSRDNFQVDEKSGHVQVSSTAQLDRDTFGSEYNVVVYAVDMGAPHQQTATATLTVTVEDVNNKPPVFTKETYVQHISESLAVGEEVLFVEAKDTDEDADVRYSLAEPITARDKTGTLITSAAYNYKEAFAINATTGEISIAQPLDYNAAAVITLSVVAEDINAVPDESSVKQKATAEVTVYIQSESEMNPTFLPPWTPANPVLETSVHEEGFVGSTILSLAAYDPVNHVPVNRFEKVPDTDPGNYFSLSTSSGTITLNQRLNYETLDVKNLTLEVKAWAQERSCLAKINVNVLDINDNSPIFTENSYETSIRESLQFPEVVLTLKATDADTQKGFGTVQYSVSGDGSDVFTINNETGQIQVKEGAKLDRETQAVYNLLVTASDSPQGGASQRKTSILVKIKVLDENDNAPSFSRPVFTAVVPENVPTNFNVITIKATDPDEEKNGEIQYSIIEDDTSPSHISAFTVDPETGTLTVVRPLTGKGRKDPYRVMLHATDRGNPPLSSTVPVMVIVGDVSSNDGVPQFVRPTLGEAAYIYENVTIGTMVFQVLAFDPDTVETSKGRVAYRFLDEERTVSGHFTIDAASGVIATSAQLDRETKENYTIIIAAQDFGFPPQEAHHLFNIYVLDVDDNEPRFRRPEHSEPIEMNVKEEIPTGTVIGKVQAVDEDKNDNAIIDYYIIGGNKRDVFGIRRTFNNEGELYIKNRLDREEMADYLLTIQVTKPSKPLKGNDHKYNPSDPSQIQIRIRVEDADDNPPVFDQKSYEVGARLNTEVDTELVRVKAIDPDSSSGIVTFNIKSTSFTQMSSKDSREVTGVFEVHPHTGVLRNSQSLGQYAGGHFIVRVEAQSSTSKQNVAEAEVKVFVHHDKDLMKFVFNKRPNDVQDSISRFQRELRAAISQPVSLNIYETQYHNRKDGSLDFESTSSCFQMMKEDSVLQPEKILRVLDSKKSPKLQKLFETYSVVSIEPCTSGKLSYTMSWAEMFVLVVAAFIGIAAAAIALIVCWLYNKYKVKLRRTTSYQHMPNGMQTNGSMILSPAQQQRIYEWQETNALPADAQSFRSFPTLR